LYAALDPYVKLFVVDGKNSPDWRKFVLVADMMIFGTHPNRDGDPIDQLLWLLNGIKKHIMKVNEVLSQLPADQCPEGKLTRDLARDPRYPDLRVWLLVMEEFQLYFETDDQDTNKEIAGLLSYIQAVGPSAGVIILSSSQKPSGVGAGDVARLFNRYRDNHAVRFALRCGNRIVSEAVLGGDAYSEGYDASSLPNGVEYRGIGYLYGLTDDTPTVRTYLADHPDAEKILLAARRHREAAGTLSGMAAGEDVARQIRDVLADARSVFYAGEAWISWKQLAARMAEKMPEHYADLTKEAISAQVRALKVAPKKGKFEGASVWGVPLDGLEQAAKRREIEAGP
jgi:S-DNA-T family DNA segregation ATPase FtsK/SpoIIIE